jgi:hypothetical protein
MLAFDGRGHDLVEGGFHAVELELAAQYPAIDLEISVDAALTVEDWRYSRSHTKPAGSVRPRMLLSNLGKRTAPTRMTPLQ